MKKLSMILLLLFILSVLFACGTEDRAQVVATTLPVYEFTEILCKDTPITVSQLVTENVSCLHDYTLQVGQMRMIEDCELVVISGAGLEDFLEDALHGAENVLDASEGLSLTGSEHHHDHDHEHTHSEDPHIWLSPTNAIAMAHNICQGLCTRYPQFESIFLRNLDGLTGDLSELQCYGEEALASLGCREMITFHDGFAYFAESFDLSILRAVEEESGSEASAAELIDLICTIEDHRLPAVFIEVNGADAAANIIAAETGVRVYMLDMAMSGSSYFSAMRHNIDTVREAME